MYQEYREKMLSYIKLGIRYMTEENELEKFYELLDELEIEAELEPAYFALVAEGYSQLNNYPKAKEAFSKVYNPKNKKDIKKMWDYTTISCMPITRPSKRAKVLPHFKYVTPKIIRHMFITLENEYCAICKKKDRAMYVGIAYKKDFEKLIFANMEDKFCVDCLCNGSAAKTYNISFNNPMIKNMININIENLNELRLQTPTCSEDGFGFNEDIWPNCCGDFCYYSRKENLKYYFECLICGKEIVWKKLD